MKLRGRTTRINLGMLKEYSMTVTIKGLARGLAMCCGLGMQLIISASRFLALSTHASASETDRQLHDAELFGEYNFRSGRLDAGSDQNGWYEEDM